MTASTLSRPWATRKVAGVTRHHVARTARLLAERRGLKSDVAAQRQIDRAREVMADLAAMARGDREVAEWLRWWLAPGIAALRADDVAGALPALLEAKAVADANEDIALQRCAVDPSPENRRKLAALMRVEMSRSAEALVALEDECANGLTASVGAGA